MFNTNYLREEQNSKIFYNGQGPKDIGGDGQILYCTNKFWFQILISNKINLIKTDDE
jgi:hypothetical protein